VTLMAFSARRPAPGPAVQLHFFGGDLRDGERPPSRPGQARRWIPLTGGNLTAARVAEPVGPSMFRVLAWTDKVSFEASSATEETTRITRSVVSLTGARVRPSSVRRDVTPNHLPREAMTKHPRCMSPSHLTTIRCARKPPFRGSADDR
jgi:hypothetical protein